jgi:hypothetical protein
MPRTNVNPELLERIRPLVQQGLSSPKIAKMVGIGERAVRFYVEHINKAERTSPDGSGAGPTPPAAEPVMVPLAQIHVGSETQARERIDQGVINEYVERMTEGDLFPPVTLFLDGTTYWIGDGFHRCYAASRVGFTSIRAEIRQGSRREAWLYAASANHTHGLRRTPGDKRHAVMGLLQDAEWRQWSDRAIARHCGVSPTFVGSLRASLSTVDSETGQRTYTTKYGTVTTMDTTHIGTRPAMEEALGDDEVEPHDMGQADLLHGEHARTKPPAPANGAPAGDHECEAMAPAGRSLAENDQWDEALQEVILQVSTFLRGVEENGGVSKVMQGWAHDRTRAWLEEATRMGACWTAFVAELQDASPKAPLTTLAP